MSVLFLPPSAGAASVPDASETVSGKIRIATSAEATAGTNDLTAMTPAKTKSVVDAAVVGGVTYQGTFDASSPADLSNATKGDLYIISVAGTYQGQTWAVGDHLLINADMGGTLDPAKIDKVDNTDSVTSVAGRTGAVTLSTADISGLATVASTGAYSDLTGTPTLATVATTGAYSDLSGTPTLGTAAAEDVGTSAGNVVQLNGSAQLPAVDGSLLTGLPSDVSSITSNFSLTVPTPSSPEFVAVRLQAVGTGQTVTLPTAGAGVNGTTVLVANDNAFYSISVQPSSGSIYLRNISSASVTLEPNQVATFTAISGIWFVTDLNYLNLDVSSPANGEALVYNGTSGLWENSTVSASVAALNDIGDVSAAAPSNTNVIKYNSTSGDWESGAVAYSEVTGTPTLGTAAAEDVGTSAGNVVQLDGTAKLPAVDGSQLTNLPTGGFTYQEQSTNAFSVSVTDSTNNIVMCSILGTNTTVLPASSGVADGTVVTLRAAIGTTLSVSGGENLRNLTGTLVSSVVIESGQNMSFVRGSTSSFGTYWNQLTAEEGTLNSLYDVKTAGAVATNVLKYDGTDWVDGAVAYSEVTGTPTLGTAAALDVGTSANNVVQLNGSAQLPAVDGSLLTGITASVAALNNIGDVSAAAPNDGDVIIYNSTSGDWEASALPIERFRATVSSGGTLTAISDNRRQHYDVTVSGVAVTIPNGGSSDVTGGIISVRNASSGDITYKGPATSWADGTQSGFKTLRPYQTGVLVWTSQYTTSEISNLYGTAAGEDVGTAAGNVVQLDGSARLPAVDGSQLTNLPTVAALNDIGDVSAAAPSNTNVIKYNSTSGDWESGAVAYSEVTGTPTLGTAAALDVGTSANNVVQLNGSAQLPAVDGSLLTGITATVAALNDIGDVSAASPNNGDVIAYNSTSGDWEATAQSGGSAPSVTVSSPSTDQTLTSPSGIEEVYIYTPSASINVNLVAAATCGSGFKYQIKNRSANTLTIDPNGTETIDGTTTFALTAQEASVTLITDGSNWFII